MRRSPSMGKVGILPGWSWMPVALDAAQMQAIATEVGDSETAFLLATDTRPNVYDVRYFSPAQEVPFGACDQN